MSRGRGVDTHPTEFEIAVLAALWSLKEATVRQVVDEIAEHYELEYAYTTILTVLRQLYRKGWVRRKKAGHAHRYLPELEQRQVRLESISRILWSLYDGEASAMIADVECFLPRNKRRS